MKKWIKMQKALNVKILTTFNWFGIVHMFKCVIMKDKDRHTIDNQQPKKIMIKMFKSLSKPGK